MLRNLAIVQGLAIIVWAYCGALIGFGRQYMSMDATLVLHAIGAPIGAAIVAMAYFRFIGYFSPLAISALFVGTALFLDFFVVSLFIEKSFAMFASALGVWIPLTLIFIATYAVGQYSRRNARA